MVSVNMFLRGGETPKQPFFIKVKFEPPPPPVYAYACEYEIVFLIIHLLNHIITIQTEIPLIDQMFFTG